MLKDKKYNLYALIVSSIISIILFAYIELCLGFVECGGVYAIFLLLSGLSVTLATLLFFDGYIFILWLRHIFWGYVSLAFITVVLFNISKSYYDKDILFISVIFLFITTLIYALIMHHRLKKKNQ